MLRTGGEGHDRATKHEAGDGDEMQADDGFRQPFIVFRRRNRVIQAKERSTTQHRGNRTKPRSAGADQEAQGVEDLAQVVAALRGVSALSVRYVATKAHPSSVTSLG
jgi:hypothetical protein